MENLIFEDPHPKTPDPMATKINRGDYVPDIYPYAKCITIRVFFRISNMGCEPTLGVSISVPPLPSPLFTLPLSPSSPLSLPILPFPTPFPPLC